jgi:aryl-alcohol dehydrogenase-like predicted oxidoreductase
MTIRKNIILGGDYEICRMGFGAMRITGEGVWGPPKNREEALKVLRRCLELGINFIDTADSYGPNVSEELIAEALYPYPESLVIATKGGLTRTGPNQWPINSSPSHLKAALEGSLKRLKVDCIQLYQLHRVDPEVPYEETLEFLQDVQEQGLVRHIGLSEVTIDQIQKAKEYFNVVSVQNKYSIDERKWEPVLQYCEQEGIVFIPWYPMGGGNLQLKEILETIGRKYNATAHQIALSWLLHHSEAILLIPGTSKTTHLEENFKALNIELTKEDMDMINSKREK